MMNFALHSVPATVRHSIQFFTWLRLLPLYHHHMQIPEMQSMALWTAIIIIYPFLTAPTTRVVSPPDPAFNRTEYASHSFRLQRGRMVFTEIPLRVDLHSSNSNKIMELTDKLQSNQYRLVSLINASSSTLTPPYQEDMESFSI